jgi:hypothetical protein
MQKVPYLNILPQTSEKCGFVMLTENTFVASNPALLGGSWDSKV